MAMNPIQFQRGLSLLEFMERYGSEAAWRFNRRSRLKALVPRAVVAAA